MPLAAILETVLYYDAAVERWKEALPAENEVTWKNGVRSFYFRDPADNLLEIAEGDLWPE